MNLLLLVFISTSTVFALTSQERRDISTAATEADLLIDFFTYLQITPLIASPIDPKEKLAHGPLIMFFGARWCINTKRFNPKYLQVQQQVKMNGLNVSMGKVECSLDHEEFCLNHFKVLKYRTSLYIKYQHHLHLSVADFHKSCSYLINCRLTDFRPFSLMWMEFSKKSIWGI